MVNAYLEAWSLQRHRWLVDHLFVLHDNGELTKVGSHRFACPYREISFFCLPGGEANPGDWRTFTALPSHGTRRRRVTVRGWIVGLRCHALQALPEPELSHFVPIVLARLFTSAANSAISFEAIIDAVDCALDLLDGSLHSLPVGPEYFDAANFSGISGNDLNVSSLALALNTSSRSLRRQFRFQTGLSPKQWLTTLRFNTAISSIATNLDSLVQIAAASGYSDQAHMTTDFGRHAGITPAEFRALARKQVHATGGRFFKDVGFGERLRLLLNNSSS